MTSIVKPCITEHEQMADETDVLETGFRGHWRDYYCWHSTGKKSHRCELSSLAFVPGRWGWSGNKHPAELFTHGSSLALITCAVVHPPFLAQIYSKPLKELTMEIDSSPSHFLSVVCVDAWQHLWCKGRKTKEFCGLCLCVCAGSLSREIWRFIWANKM